MKNLLEIVFLHNFARLLLSTRLPDLVVLYCQMCAQIWAISCKVFHAQAVLAGSMQGDKKREE